MNEQRFNLMQDTKGAMWDMLLYIPTVTILLLLAGKFWYGGDVSLAYLLIFLGSFFLIAGTNRILKTRLMLLPSAPVAIAIGKSGGVGLILRGGELIDLVSNVRFYSDYAGRSFGLTGSDGSGRRLQFIFHKGQFPSPGDYQAVADRLRNLSS